MSATATTISNTFAYLIVDKYLCENRKITLLDGWTQQVDEITEKSHIRQSICLSIKSLGLDCGFKWILEWRITNHNLAVSFWLQNLGANVNQKLFRGYATTAAVREGHIEVLEILLNGGAAQVACEEALLEASYLGRARAAELLMASDMIRPHVALHALVVASSRGFVDFVQTLIKVLHV